MYDEIAQKEGCKWIAGGSALNTCRAASYTLQKNGTSGKVVYFGSIGDGNRGKALAKIVEQSGVKEVMHREPNSRTGVCAVVVVGKERSLCASLGACQKYPTSHLIENWVKSIRLIILGLR